MPSVLYPPRRTSLHELPGGAAENAGDRDSQVIVTDEAEDTIAQLHSTITGQSLDPDRQEDGGAFAGFENYLRRDEQARAQYVPLSVCFKSLTTYGRHQDASSVKTLKDAIVRTFTLQDIYELTLKRLISPVRAEDGRPLIRDFTGVVRNGEMMLVLGNPGSGCSTFLRTIGNDRSSFLGIKGSIDYSGLSPDDVSKHCRGLVSYVPEDDIHLPTLTVRQTLEFALKAKTPKRSLHEIPLFLEEFGRVFGVTHVMDTLVGDEFIRGISGGERKRVSILESLASGSSVNAWDGSTRGLDASSAADYVRSLRIMTDACQRATIVSLYQASDATYELMDKVMLIDDGRMLFQGYARDAEAYFNSLGYQRLPRQTMSDFLTSIPLGTAENIRPGYESRVPRGAVDLEREYRASQAFKDVQNDVLRYEQELDISGAQGSKASSSSDLKQYAQHGKSKYVSPSSPYNTSFPRQVFLCLRRGLWQLQGDKLPSITRMVCNVVSAFLLGSMFYDMPDDTAGVYSRGGFSFYSTAIVAWFQLSELETAFFDRVVVSRAKRYAAVRPSAVVVAKALLDIPSIFIQAAIFSLIVYFLGGMRTDAGSFFTFVFAVFFSALAFTASYRVFGACSRRLDVALRYCGILLLVCTLCGGYVRSVENLMSETPWVGWLAYITPVPYAYEIIMATEFHNRDFPCAPGSLIPSGPGYDDAAFQSCASTGVLPGETSLQGDAYVLSQFGFRYSNVGRNFGILAAFAVGFIVINMFLVEKVDWVGGGGGALKFAHSTGKVRASRKSDEETTDESVVGSGVVVAEKLSKPTKGTGVVQSGSAFTWRDLNYSVAHKDGDKKLLNGVSGYCEPGKLTALVGASGAGKSTLMTVLTQQATGTLTGEMKVDGKDVDSTFGREIGYCQQMDIHVETSTVREAFEFSALLRQSRHTSQAEKLAYVDEVLEILGMVELQHVVIGSLSLEQKKRTTIGVELCAKPSLLLFLDEPTSGLDSQGSMNIVRLLRRLSDAGQAIICTIHQASQEQFELFDRVLALDRGGKVYYFGETGDSGEIVLDYFARNGLASEPGKNIADLMIEATARNSGAPVRDWGAIWDESPEAAAVNERIDAISSKPPSSESKPPGPAPQTGEFASSTFQQSKILTKRTFIQYWRTPEYIYSRLYCSVAHAGINGLIFLQLGNSVADMQYRVFSFFMVLMIVPEFINACSMMFIDNRNIWLGREYPSRIYGWVSFTTAQVLSEIPFALAGAVIFYVLIYFLIGLPLGTPAGYTFLMMTMFHLFCTSWGQWIAALSANAVMAASVMPILVLLFEFFNGILQPHELMPDIWAYTLYYISPFTYWIAGILSMILPGLKVACTESELIRFEAPSGSTCGEYAGDWLARTTGYLADANATGDCGFCQYSSGEDYLSNLQITASKAWPWLGIFAMFTVTNYLCVYLCVYIKSVRNWIPW